MTPRKQGPTRAILGASLCMLLLLCWVACESKPTCQSEADCLSGQSCTSGHCQTSCQSNDECLASERCIEGNCQSQTSPDAQSPEQKPVDGACVSECQQGQKRCSQGARQSCVTAGACLVWGADTPCPKGSLCSEGACVESCKAGQTTCAGACVSLQSDSRNCGTCGTSCAAKEACVAGRCESTCPTPALQLQSNGSYDVPLRTFTLRGTLTRNKQRLPDGGRYSRGTLVFTSTEGSQIRMKSFATTGEATYTGELFEGTYEITYTPDTSCRTEDPLPCQRLVLKRGLKVQSDGVLDFDLKVITLQGLLTKNKAPIPSGGKYSRGRLQLRDTDGHTTTLSTIPTTGAARYTGKLFPGTYDLLYKADPSCQQEDPLPCQEKLLKSSLSIQNNGVFDFDLKVVSLQGQLTKNGAQVPAGGRYSRGSIKLQAQGRASSTLARLPTTGAAHYEGQLFAGTYDVTYAPDASCKTEDPLPCQQKQLKAQVSLQSSGVLDFDLKVVSLQGQLTKNGAQVPAGGRYSRGSIKLTDAKGASFTLGKIDKTGIARYEGQLFAGTYDISYTPDASCKADDPLPCQQKQLKAQAGLQTSGVLDFDLKVLTLQGQLRANQAQVADGGRYSRGAIRLEEAKGGSVTLAKLERTGPAQYKGALFAGLYQVLYIPDASCKSDDPLPCQKKLLKTQVSLQSSGVLDFNVKVIQLQGVVTKNGKPLPQGGKYNRGSIVLTDTTGAFQVGIIPKEGTSTYKGKVFTGTYTLSYKPDGSCQSNDPLPCQQKMIAGCPQTK